MLMTWSFFMALYKACRDNDVNVIPCLCLDSPEVDQ